MGIPSFYKHLLQTVAGLTSRKRSIAPHIFALDLNCAIYHCVRRLSGVAEYSAEGRIVWENRLITEVVAYIQSMTRLVAPTHGVYIAVDGVVPMAKIKQQRYRRFKSGPAAAEERAIREAANAVNGTAAAAAIERWDTNAITPGTAFMERLGVALHAMRIAGCPRVSVSAADEPGEGEQKIMAWLRNQPLLTTTDVVIYGLDADLIVLALLEHARTGRRVDLFREETEFGGGVKRDALGDEQYLFLDGAHLATVLADQHSSHGPQSKQQFIYDFVGIMNLLGNDFVPHSMSLKIHDQGIEHALEAAKALQGRPLVAVDPVSGRPTYSADGLPTLLEMLGAQEERWMLKGIRAKLEARVGASAAKDAEGRALAALNDRPVVWAAEKVLVEAKMVEGVEKPVWFMRSNWRSLYYQHGLGGAAIGDTVAAYRAALAWTLDYYFGEPVDPDWYFPWLLPPLFGDIAAEIRRVPRSIAAAAAAAVAGFLRPVEQLAMVLPATSFHLLPRELQDLPARHPWAWPVAWSSYSLGRRFLWECEPQIPLIQPAQIRTWVGAVLA